MLFAVLIIIKMIYFWSQGWYWISVWCTVLIIRGGLGEMGGRGKSRAHNPNLESTVLIIKGVRESTLRWENRF